MMQFLPVFWGGYGLLYISKVVLRNNYFPKNDYSEFYKVRKGDYGKYYTLFEKKKRGFVIRAKCRDGWLAVYSFYYL